MKFIAHRGLWNKINKPNSYNAIYNGLHSEKYIGIETDIRVTRDGVFIIYHDSLYKGKLVKNILYKVNIKSRALSVMLYLVDRANKDLICFPSIKTISKDLNISVSTTKIKL